MLLLHGIGGSWRNVEVEPSVPALAWALAPVSGPVARNRLVRYRTWRAFIRYPGRAPAEAIDLDIRDYGRSPSFFRTLRWLSRNQAVGLEEITCPAHVVCGSQDFLIPSFNAVRFQRVIAGVTVSHHRRLEHASILDDPELILREVEAVATVDAGGPARAAAAGGERAWKD